MIQTPDHSSFPSGHATEAFAIATVLNSLDTGGTAQKGVSDLAIPFKLAHRIAANRVVAGVHYPCDSDAGAMMGCAIGSAIISVAQQSRTLKFEYDPYEEVGPEGQTQERVFLDMTPKSFADRFGTPETNGPCASGDNLFTCLWERAKSEWPKKETKDDC